MFLIRTLHKRSNLRRYHHYFKITNHQEKCYDYQYVDGLNVLKKPLPLKIYDQKEFFYTDTENISRFLDSGVNLRRVSLPVNDPDLQIVTDGYKRQTNKIIFEEKYSLFDPATYKIFNSDITKNPYIVKKASEIGNIDFLKKWQSDKLSLEYSDRAINLASKNGHIDILNWWIKSGLELKYNYLAMHRITVGLMF
jgi:hypothetical protein